MYWNNPLIEMTWPSDDDPIVKLSNGGIHLLYYDPVLPIAGIQCTRSIEDLCQWANREIAHNGISEFIRDPNNRYDIANLVKINIWVDDIRQRGIIKPFLLLDRGHEQYEAGTGDTRLLVLQCLPEITMVPSFISTHQRNHHKYRNLELVDNFDRFAEICAAKPGQQFKFRPTDSQADYGLYWYEYDSELTRPVTPGESRCIAVFEKYITQNSQIQIDRDWFMTPIHWPELNDPPMTKKDLEKFWRETYHSIRDPSWPDCDSIEKIDELPENIKLEIVKIHGVTLPVR
jgi:hypothetical protein